MILGLGACIWNLVTSSRNYSTSLCHSRLNDTVGQALVRLTFYSAIQSIQHSNLRLNRFAALREIMISLRLRQAQPDKIYYSLRLNLFASLREIMISLRLRQAQPDKIYYSFAS